MGFEETAGMVSNTLSMDLEELIETLKRVGQTCDEDPEYLKLRAQLPDDWPI